MAEFRSVGGEMVTHRRPAGRRVLLAYEQQLIDTVGITEPEYWEFVSRAEAYKSERPEGYELIPDIRNEPISLTTVLVNLAIGVALTAASALLTPKPRTPDQVKRREDIRTGDVRGQSRFTRVEGFDSVQELASLGAIIPLIFANRNNSTGLGGVRAYSVLLWSQLVSRGTNQILKALLLHSTGPVVGDPNQNIPSFDGFAIGDLLLRDYSPAKLSLYFRPDGGRPNSDNQYPQSGLKAGDKGNPIDVWYPSTTPGADQTLPYFSGTRSPGSTSQFGAFFPMPNGMMFKLNYEISLVQDGTGSDAKDAARGRKEKYMRAWNDDEQPGGKWPRFMGVTKSGSTYYYEIAGGEADNDSDYKNQGVEDAVNATNGGREQVDSTLAEGEQFLLGESLATIVDSPEEIWKPGTTRRYKLNVDENLGVIHTTEDAFYEDDKADARKVKDSPGKAMAMPWERLCVQRAAVASFSNTRSCDATEIGLKSIVFRQITGFANVNSYPGDDVIEDYEEKGGGSITLGQLSKYTKRFSFFRLYARQLGSGEWIELTKAKSGIVFAIRGNAPVEMYNTLHIKHPNEFSQHEFRLVPYPGNSMINHVRKGGSQLVYLLNGTMLDKISGNNDFSRNGYTVYWTGTKYNLSQIDLENREWVLGAPETRVEGNIVTYKPTTNKIDKGVVPRFPVNWGKEQYAINNVFELDLLTGAYNDEGRNTMVFVRGDGTAVAEKKYGNRNDVRGLESNAARWPGDNKVYKYLVVDKKQEKSDNEWKYSSFKLHDISWGSKRSNTTSRYGVVEWDNNKFTFYWDGQNMGEVQTSANSDITLKLSKNRTLRLEDYDNPVTKEEVKEKKKSYAHTADTYCLFFIDAFGNRAVFRVLFQGSYKAHDSYYDDGYKYVSGRVVRDYSPGGWQYKRGPRYNFVWPNNGSLDCVLKRKTDGRYEFWWYGTNRGISNNRSIELTEDGQRVRYYSVGGEIDGKRQTWKIQKDVYQEPVDGVTEVDRYEKRSYKKSWRVQEQTKSDDVKYDYYSIKWKKENDNAGSPTDIVGVTTEAVSGGSGSGATFEVTSYGVNDKGQQRKEFVISSPGKGYKVGDKINIDGVLNDKGNPLPVDVESLDDGRLVTKDSLFLWNAASDYLLYDAENMSHQSEPEHEVVFINEIIKQSGDEDDNRKVPQYPNMAVSAIKLVSTKEWKSFSNLSAYFEYGVSVEKLVGASPGPTNLLPEIAWALLTDSKLGAGAIIGPAGVNRDDMILATRFCIANGFYWDGVIDQRENLRSFIYEMASYAFMDLTIVGGRFSLIPAVPYDTNYVINRAGKPEIKALFGDGNVKDMKISFLGPEERQMFKAVVVYRREKQNSFPEVRTAVVKRKVDSDNLPTERFDFTQWCTSRSHALRFAKFALMIRATVDHGLTFQTTPQAAMSLAPGDYFRFVSQATHFTRLNNGSIDSRGYITSADGTRGGQLDVFWWKPGTQDNPTVGTITVVDGHVAEQQYWGCLFCLRTDAATSRVYRCESLSYADDGLVEVAGSYAPLTASGSLEYLQWNESTFDIQES